MRTSKALPWILAASLIALLAWGLGEVILAPLESGDAYAPYSSLRADPLGAKALYESFAALAPSIEVSRLYKERPVLEAGSAMFVLGLNPIDWTSLSQHDLTEYETLVDKGGRLIVGFLPVRARPKRRDNDAPDSAILLKDRWDLRIAYAQREDDDDDASDNIPRDSVLFFNPGKSWTVLSSVNDHAFTIERPFGAGSIVLLAQIYPLSNEGLSQSRDAAQFASLVGSARKIVFDETHLGVVETGSVTTLMRQYHLEWGAGVLVIVALLFLWRSSSSLLPPRSAEHENAVVGRDAQEGMVALLERSLPQKELLAACYGEWTRTSPADRRSKKIEAETAFADGRSVVEQYRAASRAAQRKSFP